VTTPTPAAEQALGLARALARLGKTDRALGHYDEYLGQRPWDPEVIDEALDLVTATGDLAAVERRCAAWLTVSPDHGTHDHAEAVHTRRIDALVALGGLDAAFAAYGVDPVARTETVIGPDEIVALVGLRDEQPRLEWFLRHHRRLGVDRFLVVDNDSTDGSAELLADCDDVVLWRTAGSYRAANCGAVWWDLMARRYLTDQWSLILDADELFVFPGSEHRPLRDLTAALDRAGVTAYRAIMVDLYGRGPQSQHVCAPGQDPLEVFPWFDGDWYRTRVPFAGPRHNTTNYWGGVRSRIFGGGLGGHILDKVPLKRARPGERVWSGNHWCDRPTAEIGGRGGLLHVKYGHAFAAAMTTEAERGEHAGAARIHRHTADRLAEHPDPDFFDPGHSVRYTGTEQLVRLGICRTTDAATRVPVTPEGVFVPAVPTVTDDGDRPEWSVVVVADAANGWRVADVLAALADSPASEVVVVTTGDPDLAPLPDDLAEVARAAGPHRVRVVGTPFQPPRPSVVNLGITAARGRWVHVVDPGWTVAPDAFRRLDAARAARPDAGLVVAAPTPLDLALVGPVVQCAFRRSVLERAGGLCVLLGGSAAFELAQRVAAHSGSAATVEAPLGCPVGEAPRAAGYGTDVVQALAAVDLTTHHHALDADAVDALLVRVADLAAAMIDADVTASRVGSALAVVAETLRAPLPDTARSVVDTALGATVR